MKNNKTIKRKAISIAMIVIASVIVTATLTGAGSGFIDGLNKIFVKDNSSERINMTDPNSENIITDLPEGDNETNIDEDDINYPRIYIGPNYDFSQSVEKTTYEIIIGVPYCNCSEITKLHIDGFLHSKGNHKNIDSGNFNYDTFSHVVDFSTFDGCTSILKAIGKHDELIGTVTINMCENEHETNSAPSDPVIVINPTERIEKEYKITVVSHDENENDILWYGFDWDDDTQNLESSLQGEPISITHIFPEYGDYNIRISVTDEYGKSSEKTVTLTVVETEIEDDKIEVNIQDSPLNIYVDSGKRVNFIYEGDFEIIQWHINGKSDDALANKNSINIESETSYYISCYVDSEWINGVQVNII